MKVPFDVYLPATKADRFGNSNAEYVETITIEVIGEHEYQMVTPSGHRAINKAKIKAIKAKIEYYTDLLQKAENENDTNNYRKTKERSC